MVSLQDLSQQLYVFPEKQHEERQQRKIFKSYPAAELTFLLKSLRKTVVSCYCETHCAFCVTEVVVDIHYYTNPKV